MIQLALGVEARRRGGVKRANGGVAAAPLP